MAAIFCCVRLSDVILYSARNAFNLSKQLALYVHTGWSRYNLPEELQQ
jgi:hypothetical protein